MKKPFRFISAMPGITEHNQSRIFNRDRWQAAKETVEFFAAGPAGEAFDSLAVLAQNIADLIANLGHLCDRAELSLPDLIATAASHYMDETSDCGEQFQFETDVCITGNPALNGRCGEDGCICG